MIPYATAHGLKLFPQSMPISEVIADVAVNVEQQATYAAAFELVQTIDNRIERGQHLWDKYGQVLTTLDQVIQAILDDRLCLDRPLNGANKNHKPLDQ